MNKLICKLFKHKYFICNECSVKKFNKELEEIKKYLEEYKRYRVLFPLSPIHFIVNNDFEFNTAADNPENIVNEFLKSNKIIVKERDKNA